MQPDPMVEVERTAMSRIAWLKIGAVGALWTIIATAAMSGWLIAKGDAARQITELRQRLAVINASAPKQGCGAEVELIEARIGVTPANVFGLALGGILPNAPHHLHLREMLTAR
jgi:hypothetical protein